MIYGYEEDLFMKAIVTLMEEHENILRMLKVVRGLSLHTFNTKEVNYDGFYKAIDFIRNYADKFHHVKEEDILFDKMSSHLGPAIQQGPVYGMLAEHDLGRLFINNLEEALNKAKNGEDGAKIDIIANAIAYTDLLDRHIFKENTAIFTFAEKRLKDDVHHEIDKLFEEVGQSLDHENMEKKYMMILLELEDYIASL